ncbi:MAG TPA: NAD/NADP octopine/nopaline dehydrogenase family protein [Candidatus Angelobacter sp.]
MNDLIRVLICGTGNGAHALAGLVSTRPNVEVRVLTQDAGRAQRWNTALDSDGLTVTVRNGASDWVACTTQSFTVTSDPKQAADGCDIIILAAPAFLHWKYLTSLEPFIENGCVIVGLPGQNGFEFEVREVLGRGLKNCVIMNFDSLPWICRIVEFGKIVRICGTKDKLVGAVQGDFARARVSNPLACVQRLLGAAPKLAVSGHLLGITLRSLNAYSHPPIMYARWKDWDGIPLERPPLFYQGIDEATAELLNQVSAEVIEISRQIMAEHPEVDLSQVIPMYEWDVSYYGHDISDKTNLMTALRTNATYEGITHPMIQTEDGRYVPNFRHRFLTEDIPFGLVVIRSIAEIAGVPTPHMDEVLSWCQEKLGKEYLVGSKLTGQDLADTRCPQRYGFTTMNDILGSDGIQVLA